MDTEVLAKETSPRTCEILGNCPLCGRPNGCRLESGEAYKGPCWCERPSVSVATLRRLLGDLPVSRCVCPACLETIAANPDVLREALVQHEEEEHREREEQPPASTPPTPAIAAGDFYWEGAAMVFTAQYHLRRGTCCGSGCRHCPFGAG